MSHAVHESHQPASLADRVLESTGESAALCYQCGKCSAGCPLADEMDFSPSQILHLLQLGTEEMEERALRSEAIWLCLTCETCHSRCPKEVDLAKIMEYLRSESMARGMVNPKAKDILAFHKSFLDCIKYTGRLYEVGLISDYKTRSWHFLQDLTAVPKLLKRGKMKFLPHLISGRAAVSRIFSLTSQRKDDHE